MHQPEPGGSASSCKAGEKRLVNGEYWLIVYAPFCPLLAKWDIWLKTAFWFKRNLFYIV